MEYNRLEMLQSEPGNESTAVTLKSIKEILAESGNLGLLQESSAPAEPQGVPQLQRPPVQQPPALQPPLQSPVPQPVQTGLQMPVTPQRVQPQGPGSLARPPHMAAPADAGPFGGDSAVMPEKPGLLKRLFGR